MTDIKFRSDMTVELIRSMASDDIVTQTAKVSTLGSDARDAEESAGLINFLVRDRHGSPFEHTAFTFYIEAPIFVWREFMRHRMASYNEESGRYKQLEPVFYLPDLSRNLIQQGKPGAYTFRQGEASDHALTTAGHAQVAQLAYANYAEQIDAGIAREVARMSLPLNIYSSAFVTINARALTNFLSLRTKHEEAVFPSFPQREIEMVAEVMEQHFEEQMPLTYAAWIKHGRVPL